MDGVSVEVDEWTAGFDDLFARIAGRFGRVESRRCARDYIRGLLGPVERKNSWQLAEYTGHRTPHRFQHLLGRAEWEPDRVCDDVRGYVFEHLGQDDGVLIFDLCRDRDYAEESVLRSPRASRARVRISIHAGSSETAWSVQR